MKYLVAISILVASAVCAAKVPSVAAASGGIGALLAVLVWRASGRKSRESETVLPMHPEMSTLTFPPPARRPR